MVHEESLGWARCLEGFWLGMGVGWRSAKSGTAVESSGESRLCMGYPRRSPSASSERRPSDVSFAHLRILAGGSPAATHFSCFAKKSKQKKATRGSSPRKSAGCLALLETTGRCGTRARIVTAQKVEFVLALRQSSRNAPVASALLSDSHRDPPHFRQHRVHHG